MIFERALDLMENVSTKSLGKSLMDCHAKGLFSLVIGGTENGNLTRVFYATRKINPYQIQLHSHCYDLNIGVVHGEILHHEAKIDFTTANWITNNMMTMKKYKYESPLNGGKGLEYLEETPVILNDKYVPVGGELILTCDDIHTVSCSKGSIWIVEECDFETNESTVLGVPFETEGFYSVPKQHQINDVYQHVLNKLQNIAKCN